MANDHTADAADRLSAGIRELEPVLGQHHFQESTKDAGKGSGGPFASADFSHADRTLHLWIRGNSLSVSYDLGGHRLDHATYMREPLQHRGGNEFPSYSEDSAKAFRALRHDLERHCQDFLSGSGEEYLRCWKAADEESRLTGFQRLARVEEHVKRQDRK